MNFFLLVAVFIAYYLIWAGHVKIQAWPRRIQATDVADTVPHPVGDCVVRPESLAAEAIQQRC